MRSERIEYVVAGTAMVGYLAVDDVALGQRRPGVPSMHERGGQDDSVRARANRARLQTFQIAQRGAIRCFQGGSVHGRLSSLAQ